MIVGPNENQDLLPSLDRVAETFGEKPEHALADGAFATGLGDDLGLALVMLGVEHFVLDAALLQEPREPLALFDRHGAHEHRPPRLLNPLDLVARHGLRLLAFR